MNKETLYNILYVNNKAVSRRFSEKWLKTNGYLEEILKSTKNISDVYSLKEKLFCILNDVETPVCYVCGDKARLKDETSPMSFDDICSNKKCSSYKRRFGKTPIPSKEELETFYNKPGISIGDVASYYNVGYYLVTCWFDYHKITKKTHLKTTQEKNKLTQTGKHKVKQEVLYKLNSKEWLYDQRIIQKKSKDSIAEILGISGIDLIEKFMIKHDIPEVRYNESSYKVQKILENKQYLESLYQNNNMDQVAQIVGTSGSTISLKFKELGIEAKESNSYPRIKEFRSKGEIELFQFLETKVPNVRHTVRNIIKGELDIYFPSQNLAVEFNGLYYHSEFMKSKNYHLDKTNLCKEKGIFLFHVWEDDWNYKKEIIKSMLLNKLKLTENRVYARKCKIKALSNSEIREFLEATHIQGYTNSTVNYGLFYEGSLAACMTFNKPRFNKKFDWELVRYSVKTNTSLVGGFSKLLSHFRKNHSESIITYADLSYSSGEVYEKNGFKKEKVNPPSYHYVIDHFYKRVPRTTFTKKNLMKLYSDLDASMSESDMVKIKKIPKIWGCGTIRYVLK